MADNGKKTGNWKRSRSNNEGQHGKKQEAIRDNGVRTIMMRIR